MIKSILQCDLSYIEFTVADWINSLAAISALVTAIVTWITVREIRKQREHSYHPDINIANFDFYVYKYDLTEEEKVEGEIFSLYYSLKQLSETDPKRGYNELVISINNIGLAVAKNISWAWSIDFEGIGHALKSEEEDFINYTLKDKDLAVECNKLGVDWFYFINEENGNNYFNFILPYSIENRKNEIKIPASFLDLYWLYKSKEVLIDNHFAPIPYPPLQLHVKYTNMHSKEIEKTFLLFLEWSFVSNPLNEQNEMAKFRIEIQEVSE